MTFECGFFCYMLHQSISCSQFVLTVIGIFYWFLLPIVIYICFQLHKDIFLMPLTITEFLVHSLSDLSGTSISIKMLYFPKYFHSWANLLHWWSHVHQSVRLIWQGNCWGREYSIPENLCFCICGTVFIFDYFLYFLYLLSELISQVNQTWQSGSGTSFWFSTVVI